MELKVAIDLIKKYVPGHQELISKYEKAKQYYKKRNDILIDDSKKEKNEDNIRNADNRIPSNFYKLLVNQEAAYMYKVPPLFDVGKNNTNKLVQKTLGDAYAKKCKKACVEAQHGGIAWIHYWTNAKNEFQYAILSCEQVIPVYTDDLNEELSAIIRAYRKVNEDTGKLFIVYEIWTNQECSSFMREEENTYDEIQPYLQFSIVDLSTGESETAEVYEHDYGEVPFIPMLNNDEVSSNLEDIKELIDSYDKVFSGFVNDLEDIQEIILILTNYGGEAENVGELWNEIKQKKVIQVESDGADDKSGVSTLAIEIPVEAREKLLTITRKAIFEQGQGIDPDPQNFGNSSGVALGYLYSLLELKAGMQQTEFEIGLAKLVRAICNHYNLTCDDIIQTWTRTSVSNDEELATIAAQSKGIISDETIVKNHPWVKDPEKEMERLRKQNESEQPNWDEVPIEKD